MTTGEIVSNTILKDSYYKAEFFVPDICAETQPGQFVHVKIANLRDRILRRPFSISDVSDKGILTVIYKVVGEGTEVLALRCVPFQEAVRMVTAGEIQDAFSVIGILLLDRLLREGKTFT